MTPIDSSDSSPVIEVHGLSKIYHIYDKPEYRLWQGLLRGRRQFFREFWALRDVSFTVRKGETLGIIGRNGSGKSTLLQILCGTLTPTAGSVRVVGRVGALLELGAGFNPEFTGRENVYLNASVLGLARADVDERFSSIAAFADIGQFIDQPVKTYSSGMFVRLAFAVIAHLDADVLIIDEALAVGDALFAQKCMRFLHRFRAHGTILFVSHDTGAVLNLCDKAVWLQDGQVVGTGEAKGVVEGYAQWNMEQLQGTASARVLEPHLEQQGTAGRSAPANGVPIAAETVPLSEREATGAGLASNERPDRDYGFGKGGATIEYVGLHYGDGKRTHAVKGGDAVTLRVAARATEEVLSPIIGFHFKDRLGQIIFGENSFLSTLGSELALQRGESIVACFDFIIPHMKTGEYVFDIAFAEGTQAIHVQHHWVYDALLVHVMTEHPVFGILSIPYSVAVHKFPVPTSSDASSRDAPPAPAAEVSVGDVGDNR